MQIKAVGAGAQKNSGAHSTPPGAPVCVYMCVCACVCVYIHI